MNEAQTQGGLPPRKRSFNQVNEAQTQGGLPPRKRSFTNEIDA